MAIVEVVFNNKDLEAMEYHMSQISGFSSGFTSSYTNSHAESMHDINKKEVTKTRAAATKHFREVTFIHFRNSYSFTNMNPNNEYM